MKPVDVTDVALVAELRAAAEQSAAELADWQLRANEALATAEALRQRVAELEAEVETLRCGDLQAFIEHDLEPDRHEAFEAHLARCRSCEECLALDQVLRTRVSEISARAKAKERS